MAKSINRSCVRLESTGWRVWRAHLERTSAGDDAVDESDGAVCGDLVALQVERAQRQPGLGDGRCERLDAVVAELVLLELDRAKRRVEQQDLRHDYHLQKEKLEIVY
eukprot:6191501-Pleurochrysis_carterae.AAC.5